MITISEKDGLITVINLFQVEGSEHQQRLVDYLVENLETPRKLPGFISANIHTSLDGTRVVNYVQWRSLEELEAGLKRQGLQGVAKQAGDFAPHDFKFYKVVFTAEAQ